MTEFLNEALDDSYAYTLVERDVASETMKIWFFQDDAKRTFSVRMMRPEKLEVFEARVGVELKLSECNPQTLRVKDTSAPPSNIVKFYATVLKIVQEIIDVDAYASKKKCYMMAIPSGYYDRLQRFALRVSQRKLRASIGNLYFEDQPRTTGRNADYVCMFMARRGFDMAKIIKPDVSVSLKSYDLDTTIPASNAQAAQGQAAQGQAANDAQVKASVSRMFDECLVGTVLMFNFSQTAKDTIVNEGQVKLENIKEGANKEPTLAIKHLVDTYKIDPTKVAGLTRLIYRLKTKPDTVVDINGFIKALLDLPTEAMSKPLRKLLTDSKVTDFLVETSLGATTTLFNKSYAEYVAYQAKPKSIEIRFSDIKANMPMMGSASTTEVVAAIDKMYNIKLSDPIKVVIKDTKKEIENLIKNVGNAQYFAIANYVFGLIYTGSGCKFMSDKGVEWKIGALNFLNVQVAPAWVGMPFVERLVIAKNNGMSSTALQNVVKCVKEFGVLSLVGKTQWYLSSYSETLDAYKNIYNALKIIDQQLCHDFLMSFSIPSTTNFITRMWYVGGLKDIAKSYLSSPDFKLCDDQMKKTLSSFISSNAVDVDLYKKYLDAATALEVGIKNDPNALENILSSDEYLNFKSGRPIYFTDASRMLKAMLSSSEFRDFARAGKVNLFDICDVSTIKSEDKSDYDKLKEMDPLAYTTLTVSCKTYHFATDQMVAFAKIGCYSDIVEIAAKISDNVAPDLKAVTNILKVIAAIVAVDQNKDIPTYDMSFFGPDKFMPIMKELISSEDRICLCIGCLTNLPSVGSQTSSLITSAVLRYVESDQETLDAFKAWYEDAVKDISGDATDKYDTLKYSMKYPRSNRDNDLKDGLIAVISDMYIRLFGRYEGKPFIFIPVSAIPKDAQLAVALADQLPDDHKLKCLNDPEALQGFINKFKSTANQQGNISARILMGNVLSSTYGAKGELNDKLNDLLYEIGKYGLENTSSEVIYDINTVLSYQGDNEKLSETASKLIKVAADTKTLNSILNRIDKNSVQSLVSNIDLGDKDTISAVADACVEVYSYGNELVRKIFMPLILAGGVRKDMESSPIKPLITLTTDRIKQILAFNKIDAQSLDLKIRKSPKESYGDMFNRLADLVEQQQQKLPEQRVTELNKTDDELEIDSIALNKTRNNKHGYNELRILKSFDANVVFPEYQAWADAHPNRTVKRQMYHCTGSVAASMVLRCGFTVIPSSDPSAVGRMLGDGIYCTDVIDKAQQYLGDYGYGRAEGTTGYVFEMEVQYDNQHPRNRLSVREPQYDWAGAGFGRDNIRSPEWALLDPKAQIKIYRVHKAVIVSKQHMDRIRAKHKGVNENRSFLDKYLTEAAKDTVMFTFGSGVVPTAPGVKQMFDKVVLKPGMQWDYSGQGPMLCVENTLGYSGHWMIPDTDQLLKDDPEHILPIIYKLFA